MKTLKPLAAACAVLAGCILVLITAMTVLSVLGRDLIGKAIVGDFELVAVAAGAAVALFMPWCQLQRGHIIVDFFTAKLQPAQNALLDRLGALGMAAFMALLAWRSALGGINAFSSNAGSMMLGFPDWITYCFIVPPLVLAALIALIQAFDNSEKAAA